MSKKILFIAAHRPGRSPGQRFRFEQYLEYIHGAGFECTYSYIISEKDDAYFYTKGKYLRKFFILLKSIYIRCQNLRKAKQYDLIFIYREALMIGSSWFERQFRKKGVKIIVDYDDAIWLPDVSSGNTNLSWLKNPSKIVTIIKNSDMVFAGNTYLANFAKNYSDRVRIVPTTIDTQPYRKHIGVTDDKNTVCIGWTGSQTTLKHFEKAIPFLEKIYQKFGPKVSFKLIADVPFETDKILIEFCKWSRDKEVDDLSGIDIGIMPLPDDDWTKGKCGFKGLQYMAIGIPTIMSPVGVNTEIIQDGVNGFLADSEDEWVERLSLLIESPELRKKIGENGRNTVVDKYSFDAWKDQYIKLFNELLTPDNHS